MNKQLIKAGLCYLIDKDKDIFLDRMSVYLRDKPNLMDFLFDGPLPINEEVEQKIAEYIKTTLPCPDYFDSIVDIEIDFDYSLEQRYKVIYKATRFYDSDKRPWQGNPASDNAHPIEVITELTMNVAPSTIKI